MAPQLLVRVAHQGNFSTFREAGILFTLLAKTLFTTKDLMSALIAWMYTRKPA